MTRQVEASMQPDQPRPTRIVARTSGTVAVLVILGLTVAGAMSLAMADGDLADTQETLAANLDKPAPTPLSPATVPVPEELAAIGRTIVSFRGMDHSAITVMDAWHPIEHATTIQSDMLGVSRVTTASGQVVLDLADGYRIPVAAMFIDPAPFANVLHDGHPTIVAALAPLEPGSVLLSATGARLRGVDEGARLTLVTHDSEHLEVTVAGVIADDLAGRSEMVLHTDDTERLGLSDNPRSMIVLHRGGEQATRTIRARVTSLTGEQPHTTILYPTAGQPPVRIVLSLTEVKERFGEFAYRPRRGVREIDVSPAYADEAMVTTNVPIIGEVRCHRLIIDDLVAALEEIIVAGVADWIEPRSYAGCHYPRRISTERARLSNHSWGIAVDLNVDMSLPGLGPKPPEAIIEIFGRHGFRWGGDFSQPDNHHWEWVGEHATRRPSR